jgi:ribosomal protein S18 acetylase RimI-like enzyme
MMMADAVTFRPGTPQDGAAILSVHKRAIERVAVRDYGEEIARSWAHGLSAEGYARSMADGEVIEVAIAEGRLVGFCGHKDDEIYGLYIDPDFMRRGIASILLERALQELQRRGHRRIIVDSSLTAMRFYRRHGFRVIRERRRKTRGGLEMTALDMEWQAPDARNSSGAG